MFSIAPFFSGARRLLCGHPAVVTRLRTLEYQDTLHPADSLGVSRADYLDAIQQVAPTQRPELLLRELHFFDDGCTIIEPMLKSIHAQVSVVRREIIALYLREALEGLHQAGAGPAERLRYEERLMRYFYQAWFLRYPQDPAFALNFARDPEHGYLILRPQAPR